MPILINSIKETVEEQVLIANCCRCNDAIHQMSSRPLTIFTTLAFSRVQTELESNKPFSRLLAPFGAFEDDSPEIQVDCRFTVDERDMVVHETRWSATTGNSLEQILKTRGVDTVVISGLSLSGVVMSTIYRLFDLDYNIHVITNNVLELPVDQNTALSEVLLDTLLPKMNLRAISLSEALQALD
ncbi:Isochorismatase hydrolase [Dipodascopsis uninucleata]